MNEAPPLRGFSWGHAGLALSFVVRDDGAVRLARLAPAAAGGGSGLSVAEPTNLVEVRTVSGGSEFSGNRSVQTAVGNRLVYRSHEDQVVAGVARLDVRLHDPLTGLVVVASYESRLGSSSLSASTRVINEGSARTTLLAVSSLIFEAPVASPSEFGSLRLWWAENDWLSECRWQHRDLRPLLIPDVNRDIHNLDSRRAFGLSGLGSWSSGRYLPMGMLENPSAGLSYAWQVENPGPWRWELAERRSSAYVACFGPIDYEHQWSQVLAPGEEFVTVPATVSVASGGWSEAVTELSRARKAQRPAHRSFDAKPVVFNDYMNALMGDPTEAKLIPLIDAAADAGAEVFCIDAGWFDEGPEYWWDAVGEYEVAPSRFPNGLNVVLDRMRERGMTPGLWLEPEVVGFKSPVVQRLPADAFFQRNGELLREHDRFHLDLRHPAARGHLDALVDRLVHDHGVGYLKLDYNVNPGPGTDAADESVGAGLLGHSRALIDWLAGLTERHPDLMIMNCASGGMRMDGAIQRVTHVQQMTDQQDFLSYVPIAVAGPTAVPSDQAASWAYPDRAMSVDEVEFCLVAPLLGRFELSGQLDALDARQHTAVVDAVARYKTLRQHLTAGDPIWPLGLPEWNDEWLCFGIRDGERLLLNVWHRSGDTAVRRIPIPGLGGRHGQPVVLFPSESGAHARFDAASGVLEVGLPRTPTAVLIDLVLGDRVPGDDGLGQQDPGVEEEAHE